MRAVVLKFMEPVQISIHNRGYATKCDVTLVDDTGGKPIIVTVWDNDAVRVQKYCKNNPVVRICPICTCESSNETTYTAIGQSYPTDHSVEGQKLQEWWQTFGKMSNMG